MSKKIISLFLMLYFIFAILVSCGNSGSESDIQNQSQTSGDETISGETEDMDFKEELPELNFKDSIFTFLVEPDPSFRHLYDVNVDQENGDIVNDTIYRRNRTVEERLGITIKDVQEQNVQTIITNSVTAGDTEYNGVWLRVDNFFNASLSGIFINLYNVPYLDLEKKYWDPNAVNDMTISGKLYGMTGDITTATHSFTHMLMFNKQLAENYGYPDLYDIVRNGQWTFDKFDEVTKGIYTDLNGNGTVDKEDFFSIDITPAAYEAFFSSAGEKWVEKNDDGEIRFSDLSEKKIIVLEKIEGIFTGKDNVLIGYENPFVYERAIFFDGDLGIMFEQFRELEFDFGIVPLPKFSEEQDRYYVYAYPFFPFLSIPTTIIGETLEMTGATLEALAAESYQTLTPAFYDVALENKYVRDDASYEMLNIILRSRIYDLLYWGQWDNFRNWNTGLVSTLQKGGGEYVSTYEKNIDSAIIKIQEITDIYDNLDG